jgi:hypothetical protein
MNEQDSPLADSSNKETISLSSRKKWFWLSVVIALVSPVSGLILGIAFWTESGLRKEAKIILLVAIIWGLLIVLLSDWLAERGYLPS